MSPAVWIDNNDGAAFGFCCERFLGQFLEAKIESSDDIVHRAQAA